MKKKGMMLSELGWWLLSVALLVILVSAVIVLSKSDIGIFDKFKSLLRFR